jgi:hypothetical protein
VGRRRGVPPASSQSNSRAKRCGSVGFEEAFNAALDLALKDVVADYAAQLRQSGEILFRISRSRATPLARAYTANS